MKVLCPREGLLQAAQIAGAAVASRDVKPILSNIKAVASPNGLTLMATDLELGIRLELRSVKVEEPGEAILPAARLISILRESTDDELAIDAGPDVTMVRGQLNEFELPGENPADFPDIPVFTDDKFHELQAGLLREMVRRTSFAAARESTRYATTGILWEVADGRASLVATDGRRLALSSGATKNQGAGETKGQTHVVPTKAMSLLERLLADPEEVVKVSLRANEALFKTERAMVYTRLVEGRFPNYRDVIPEKPTVKIALDPGKFQSAVRQAAIMTEDESKRVAFNFAKKKLTLQARGAESGRAKVELPLEYDGKDLAINFDAQFLIDVLRVLPADAPLILEIVNSDKPAVFRSGPDYLYLVMPLT